MPSQRNTPEQIIVPVKLFTDEGKFVCELPLKHAKGDMPLALNWEGRIFIAGFGKYTYSEVIPVQIETPPQPIEQKPLAVPNDEQLGKALAMAAKMEPSKLDSLY